MVSQPPQGRRVAIVTGAAQGIGAAIATKLAEDGFDLGLGDLPGQAPALVAVAARLEGLGAKVVIVSCDVSIKEEVDSLVDAVVEDFGRLDVMVANAGVSPVNAFLDLTPEILDKTYAVNVRGVMLCYQAAARQMITQGWGGRLLAACSTMGLRGQPSFAAYCSSKSAVKGLNQSAALEFAKYGITCNVYCPTAADTDMMVHIDQQITEQTGAPTGSFTSERAAHNPMGRLATPQDIAHTVSYLASPGASFVTGHAAVISVRTYALAELTTGRNVDVIE